MKTVVVDSGVVVGVVVVVVVAVNVGAAVVVVEKFHRQKQKRDAKRFISFVTNKLHLIKVFV